jgi:hypothetical protein
VTVDGSEIRQSNSIPSQAEPWLRRTGLDSIDRRLVVAGADAEGLAREHGLRCSCTTAGGWRRTPSGSPRRSPAHQAMSPTYCLRPHAEALFLDR